MNKFVRYGAALATAASIAVGSIGQAGAQATVAKGANWTVSITAQNVETSGSATVTINFYPGGGAAPVTFNPASKLAAGAGTSYRVATVSGIASGFKGSAVISSDQRIVATVVQFVDGRIGGRDVRLLSNGFQSSDAASTYSIPTVLNGQFDNVTEFSIQNVEASPIKATVNFYAVGSQTATLTKEYTFAANESTYIDASTINLPAKFDGSATITAVKTSDGSAANIVAAANEYSTANGNGSSFEGVKQSANTIYMPSALCGLLGAGTAETAYAIQNADTTAATVTVTYRNLAGQAAGTATPFTLTPGAKKSYRACSDGGLPTGSNGSATISSTGGKIVAIGKVFNSGLSTSFNGQATGAAKLALPYIRYSPEQAFQSATRQRSFIAVQNVGSSAVTVKATYLDKNGSPVKSVDLNIAANGGKANTNPESAGALDSKGRFGEYDDGTFGGAVLLEAPAGSQIIATVRVQSGGTGALATGEDYVGIPVQ